MEEAKGIGRPVTMKSNKVVLTTKKTVFIHPIVRSNGIGLVTSLKESLSEKDMKEIIPKVVSCIL